MAAAETLANLHSVVPEQVGLGDYGPRAGYCRRQVLVLLYLVGAISSMVPDDVGLGDDGKIGGYCRRQVLVCTTKYRCVTVSKSAEHASARKALLSDPLSMSSHAVN